MSSFANANVLLVLGELMGGGNGEDGAPSRSAIPLIAGAIVLAQATMVRLDLHVSPFYFRSLISVYPHLL
jgi:hypothetical protein